MYDINDKAGAVREIQRYLFTLHYFTDEIPFLTIDGVYGEDTRRAVASYQRLRGLARTGIVDSETFARLYADYSAAAIALDEGAKIPPDTPLPADVGRRGVGVRNLQYLLNALLARYENAVRSDVSGVYTYATRKAVNRLRGIYLMPEDGEVSHELFLKMQRDYQNPPSLGNADE